MAVKRKKNSRISRGGRLALKVFVALLLALAAFCGIAALNASLVRVRRAEVELADLPAAFDGATILYASDIDLCGLNTAEKTGRLFGQLQSLHPDMLILGGDYTSPSLLEALYRADDDGEIASQRQRSRENLFYYIKAFDAPLGKFGVSAPEDPYPDALAKQMQEAGVVPLFNDRAVIRVGGDTLWIVGVSRDSAKLNSAGNAFQRSDCTIVVSYSPVVLPVLVTSEAQDGGRWADLALTGHTHGGQIRLFGRTALQLNRQEQHYLGGWTMENGLPILSTTGVGCEGINLRVGTEPEVWLITLRRPAS